MTTIPVGRRDLFVFDPTAPDGQRPLTDTEWDRVSPGLRPVPADAARYAASRDHLVNELEVATRAGDHAGAAQAREHLRVLAEELRRDERNNPLHEEHEFADRELDVDEEINMADTSVQAWAWSWTPPPGMNPAEREALSRRIESERQRMGASGGIVPRWTTAAGRADEQARLAAREERDMDEERSR